MNPALIRTFGALNAWVYRASGGRLLGRFPNGAKVLLLTTTGRRSGQRRTVPLLYLEDGGYVIVGSQGGAPRHPSWYLNLKANPAAALQIGSRRLTVRAEEVDDAERERLWPKLVAIYPPYEDYRKRTARKIPLIRLVPAA